VIDAVTDGASMSNQRTGKITVAFSPPFRLSREKFFVRRFAKNMFPAIRLSGRVSCRAKRELVLMADDEHLSLFKRMANGQASAMRRD
jgi:hypothetical protein